MPEDRTSCPQDDPSESLGRIFLGGDSTFRIGVTLLREWGGIPILRRERTIESYR
jgi:hypothetical protein